jgi:cellulose synthase/poly-beta-1,6-N-acetylglucosamine synthase-like glycosyltransferase
MTSLAFTIWHDCPWFEQPLIQWPLTGGYLTVLLLIATYGLHRYWLVYLYCRTRGTTEQPQQRFEALPAITVQLPMYNEDNVAERIIDAACALDYPANRLQIQVLDDSTDESAQIARRRVAHWSARGTDIEYLHREDRHGFKAGALADAMPRATGQFIAIFDADFVPPADFLERTVHHFTDLGVGMVQTRWDHLNRDDSLLTRSQAIFLDGHFVIEHTARHRSQRWINFNGTAGIWRRQAILESGNWQHDTLTEDVDLSYRAQMAGWRFVFLPSVTCPAELPPEINAFKAQQHRWTKGSIQTARKLLPAVLRSAAPIGVKVEAFFHLTSPMVYLYVTLMTLMFYPAIYVNTVPLRRGSLGGLIVGTSLFALGTASAAAFYLASQRAQRRSVLATLAQLPVLMSIGIGIALNNARGCVEALLGHESPFVRTPKYNVAAGAEARQRRGIIATPSIKAWMSLVEIAMGLYMLQCAYLSLRVQSTVVSLPFLLLFASGYLYVGITGLVSQWSALRGPRGLPRASCS